MEETVVIERVQILGTNIVVYAAHVPADDDYHITFQLPGMVGLWRQIDINTVIDKAKSQYPELRAAKRVSGKRDHILMVSLD